jgi:hypothetical protein
MDTTSFVKVASLRKAKAVLERADKQVRGVHAQSNWVHQEIAVAKHLAEMIVNSNFRSGCVDYLKGHYWIGYTHNQELTFVYDKDIVNEIRSFPFNDPYVTVKVNFLRNFTSTELINFTRDFENTYRKLCLFNFFIEEVVKIKIDKKQGIVLEELDIYEEFLDPGLKQLKINKIVITSPGFWEVIGSLNPLQQIREYLNDREERRKGRMYKNQQEQKIKNLEIEKLQNDLQLDKEKNINELLLSKFTLLDKVTAYIKSLDISEELKSSLIHKYLISNLSNLDIYQEQGLIGKIDIVDALSNPDNSERQNKKGSEGSQS